MGKNFSCNNLGQRKKSDFYETPYSITQQLLEVEDFSDCQSILEPAEGLGAITKILLDTFSNKKIIGYDLSDGVDFLKEENKYDCIITNPPFSLAKEFIIKAKEVATHKFAMLLPLSYLHGEERYNLIYKDKKYPLYKVHIFTRYPLLGQDLREDGKYKTGMMVYAWFVFDKAWHNREPMINWISNQRYILNKKDKE